MRAMLLLPHAENKALARAGVNTPSQLCSVIQAQLSRHALAPVNSTGNTMGRCGAFFSAFPTVRDPDTPNANLHIDPRPT